MYFTCNLPTTLWMREHFHSRKYLGIMLCISFWGRYPGRKSFYFIAFAFIRLYSLLVHLLVGVQEAFRQIPFNRIYTFSQLPLFNYILSHSSCIANDTNHAMREGAVHTCTSGPSETEASEIIKHYARRFTLPVILYSHTPPQAAHPSVIQSSRKDPAHPHTFLSQQPVRKNVSQRHRYPITQQRAPFLPSTPPLPITLPQPLPFQPHRPPTQLSIHPTTQQPLPLSIRSQHQRRKTTPTTRKEGKTKRAQTHRLTAVNPPLNPPAAPPAAGAAGASAISVSCPAPFSHPSRLSPEYARRRPPPPTLPPPLPLPLPLPLPANSASFSNAPSKYPAPWP